ncbi:MAG: hypothetical protein M3437_21090 [Chloroflexota bacterium]|nr:hypothetical protein [Chloroflexota bacterium]MDQ5867936.1 hypothetical protein [Chloroflexota bacterium]
MIFVIVPLGKEAKDVASWLARVVMYAVGTLVGAALTSLLVGLAGGWFYALSGRAALEASVVILGVAALLFALHELNVVRLPAPQVGWQVPASWMRRSRLLGNTLYGLVLGAGIFTFIPFASFYLLLALEFVAGAADLRAAVALGMVYGIMRGLPAVLGGISMLRLQNPVPVSDWLIARLGLWHALNALVLLLVGGFFLGSFLI